MKTLLSEIRSLDGATPVKPDGVEAELARLRGLESTPGDSDKMTLAEVLTIREEALKTLTRALRFMIEIWLYDIKLQELERPNSLQS